MRYAEFITEKAKSKSQQRFMGMVHAMQKGEKIKGASKELKRAAKSMPKKAAKDYAKTKHKGLPDHVEEAMPYTGTSPQYKGKRIPIDTDADAKDITKKLKKADMPDEPIDFDFDSVDREKLKKVVAKVISTLGGNPKDEKVLRARFGLPPFNKSFTLKQVADAMGVTPEVVRQREQRALRKLRHSSRSQELRPFLDHIEEKWSNKYKRSINCNSPKGFSQKAHCAGRNKK